MQQAKNHTVVLAGDFNLLGINWGLSSTRTDARDHQQCQYLLDIINDYHLTQLVDEPTRTTETTASILDLILTSKPALVEDIKISPGISDHDIVTASLLHQAQKNKCKPRKVLDYKHGDSEKFLKDLSRDCENFLNSHPDTNPVEANWTSFKQMIMLNASKHFPTKVIRPPIPIHGSTEALGAWLEKSSVYTILLKVRTLLSHGTTSENFNVKQKQP